MFISNYLSFLQNWVSKISQILQIMKTRFYFKFVYLQGFLMDLSVWGVKDQVYKQTFKI